jgi:hypothetical protein
MVKEALYVYGVLSASDREAVSVTGVEGSEVGTVQHDGIAALTSPVKGSALAAAREVRAHWRVLQEASEQTTVLPVRFGTVLEDEAAVREQLLEPNADQLRGLLQQMKGCVQLTVKGEYREPDVLQDIVRSNPPIAALAARVRARSPEAAYYDRIRLGELIAAKLAELRDDDTAKAMEEGGAHNAFNLSFLVRRDRQADFTQRVNSIIDETGDRIEIRYVGPLPPYSFTDAGGAPWA